MSLPLPRLGTHVGPVGAADSLRLRTEGAGVVVGVDRHGSPLALRLFRSEPTAVVLVGTVQLAQMLAFRALAVGASVAVQTGRPAQWGAFARPISATDDVIELLPPGAPVDRLGTAQHPRLVVSDTGPSVSDADDGPTPWSTTVLVRDELTAWDVEPLVRADIAILQPLGVAEAALAASTLNIQDVERSLSRIRHDLITVVSHGRVLWAQVVPTPTETQVVGTVLRA